ASSSGTELRCNINMFSGSASRGTGRFFSSSSIQDSPSPTKEYLVNLLRPILQHRTQRSHCRSVEDQILIAFRFYACGTFFQVVLKFVSFPKDIQMLLPNTIGAIDCTHEFINRKGKHSINVQLVCDADLIITNCIVKWPGSVHDAHMRASALYRDRRFACLNYLRAEPQKACNITLACIVLHNIANNRNVPLYPDQPPAFYQNEQTGHATMDTIFRHYF
uniref:DDE Tnp4 domain-containing protein n=1 Tax=Denticeps clupeoides TaxID=299321 RepID=A0AAY4EZD1_9TELE